MRLIRMLMNNSLMLCIPIWILPLSIYLLIQVYRNNDLDGDYLLGKKWLWE